MRKYFLREFNAIQKYAVIIFVPLMFHSHHGCCSDSDIFPLGSLGFHRESNRPPDHRTEGPLRRTGHQVERHFCGYNICSISSHCSRQKDETRGSKSQL